MQISTKYGYKYPSNMQKSTTPGISNLNWDDLRYFLEVARTQRASGAAKRLGVDYTTVARRVRALEDANKSLQLRPYGADAFDTRAHIFEILGRRAEAISDYQKALRLNPDIEGSKEGLKRLGAAS